jgi:hypothetical protein
MANHEYDEEHEDDREFRKDLERFSDELGTPEFWKETLVTLAAIIAIVFVIKLIFGDS